MLAKVDPYMRPLFDALYDTMDPEKLNAFIERGTIEVAPLAFMRGRTLNDSFIILDEAQNTSPEQMQMFLTRLGFGSKVVVTGDVTQIDLPREQASGLIQVQNILEHDRRHRVRRVQPPGRRAAQARAADRRGVQAARRGDRDRAAQVTAMIEVEVDNRCGVGSTRTARVELARRVLAAEGVDSGELGLAFVGPEESRALKREHLGIDEATDALAFPDRRARRAAGRDAAPARRRRRLPEVVGEEWRAPLVHARAASRRLRPRRRDGGAGGAVRRDASPRVGRRAPPAPGRAPSLLDSFNYAFEGIIHVLRTQRNLRIHFAIAIAVHRRRARRSASARSS